MFLQPCTLSGKVVRLEPLTEAHLAPLASLAFHDELWRWTTTRIATEHDLKDYIATALEARNAGTALPFVMLEAASSQIVGCTRFCNANSFHCRVEIGWTFVAPPWQRTAVNTEAKYLMLRHAFEVLQCIRVEFNTDALNVGSRAAIGRLGAKEEGLLRSHMIAYGGRIRDTVVFSITDREWPAVAAGLQQKLSR